MRATGSVGMGERHQVDIETCIGADENCRDSSDQKAVRRFRIVEVGDMIAPYRAELRPVVREEWR